jgi:hypothetical protein
VRILCHDTPNIHRIHRHLRLCQRIQRAFDLVLITLNIIRRRKCQREVARKPQQVLAPGQPVQKSANLGDHRNHHADVALAKVFLLQKNSWNVRPRVRRIQHCIQLFLVIRKPLHQVQTIGKHEDGNARTLWFLADEVQKLFPCVGFIRVFGIHQVQQKHIQRTSLGCRRDIDESIRGQRWQLGEIRSRLQTVHIKRKNFLRTPILGNGKIFRREPPHRPAIGVRHHHVKDDAVHRALQHQIAARRLLWGW